MTPHGVEVPAPKLPAGHAQPHDEHGDLHDFHIWGVEFTPTVVNFYFDGELRGSVDATLFKHTPMNIWLTSIGWGGSIDDSKLPSEAQFDYVRYFTKPEAQQPSADAATNTATASAPGTDPTQAGFVDTLTKMGAVVKTEGDAPDGAVTSIIFPYTHKPQQTPGGNTIPPYPVTDDLVHQISKLPKVTAVEFNMSPGLTEAAIKDIGGMTQLQHLSLNGMHLTDASMTDLAGLTNLNYLRLSGAADITDTGWVTLENFKQLQTLWVAETKFGDAAVQHLKPLTQLKDMTFYGTPLTDVGADVLLGLPSLVSVRCGPHMTPTEIAKLHAALPNCRFWR